MENIDLVEIRKAGKWVVAIRSLQNSENLYVYYESLETPEVVQQRDLAEFRSNTNKEMGSEKILFLCNFMNLEALTASMNSLSYNNTQAKVNQIVRGQTYYCLTQIMSSNFTEEWICVIQTYLLNFWDFYVNVLLNKFGFDQSVYLSCLPEIESALTKLLGLDECGKRFYSTHRSLFKTEQLSNLNFEELFIGKLLECFGAALDLNRENAYFLPFVCLIHQIIDSGINKIYLDKTAIENNVLYYLKWFINYRDLDTKDLNFNSLYLLMSRFGFKEIEKYEAYLGLMGKPITIKQKIQVLDCLDKMDFKFFEYYLIKNPNEKFYLTFIENQSIMRFLHKYLKIYIKRKNDIILIIKDILNHIQSIDVFVSLIKEIEINFDYYSNSQSLDIIKELMKRYSQDCRQNIINIIDKALTKFQSSNWIEIFNVVTNSIDDSREVIIIFTAILTRPEKITFMSKVLIQIIEMKEPGIAGNLFEALLDTEEFSQNYKEWTELSNKVKSNLYDKEKLDIILKYFDKTKIQKNEFGEYLNQIFAICIYSEKKLKLLFSILKKLENENDIRSILEVLKNHIYTQNNNPEKLELLFVVLFFKLNKSNLIFEDGIWEKEDFTVYRKERVLLFEEDLFNYYFYRQTLKNFKSPLKNALICMYSKFNTGTQWTKDLKQEFIYKVLNLNSSKGFEFLNDFFVKDPTAKIKISFEQVLIYIEKTTYPNDLQIITAFRSLLRLSENKNPFCNIIQWIYDEIKLILIESIISSENKDYYYPEFVKILANIRGTYLYGPIVFYIASYYPNLQVPINDNVFQSFTNSKTRFYMEESDKEAAMFQSFISNLKSRNDTNLYSEFIIAIYNQTIYPLSDSLINAFCGSISEESLPALSYNFFSSFSQNKLLEDVELSLYTKNVIRTLLNDINNLALYERFMIDSILSWSGNINHLGNLINILLLIKKQQKIFNMLQRFENEIMQIFEILTDLRIRPLVIEKSISENSMKLFGYYRNTSIQISQNFGYLLEKYYMRLNSKKLNISLTQAGSPVSLKNFGASCYINSILHLINSISSLRNSILTYSGYNESLKSLKYIVQKLNSTVRSSVSTSKFIKNYEIYEGEKIDPRIQCDCEELLASILLKLEAENIDFNDIRMSFNTHLKCICSKSTFKNQRENVLQLEILGSNSIEDCINNLKKSQFIDQSDWIECKQCGERGIRERYYEVTGFGNYFMVLLKRFRYNVETQRTEKIYTECKINSIIFAENRKYKVAVIITHLGEDNNGHYITYKKIKQENGDVWFSINDKIVTRLEHFNPESFETFNGLKEAPYIVLYELIDFKEMEVQVLDDQSIKEKNLFYHQANIYFGEAFLSFISTLLKFEIESPFYYLFYLIPYQSIGTMMVFKKAYVKFSKVLDIDENKLIFRNYIKGYKVQLFTILTGNFSNDLKLVLFCLIKKAFSVSIEELPEFLNSLFAIDHSSIDLTYILNLLVFSLEKIENNTELIQNILSYFSFKRLENIEAIAIYNNLIGSTDFSSFFKYLYKSNLSPALFKNYINEEIFSYITSYYCFVKKPKWYSKYFAKYFICTARETDYLETIIKLRLDNSIKEKLIYYLIEELPLNSSIFQNDIFFSILSGFKKHVLDKTGIEKIIKALSRKNNSQIDSKKIFQIFQRKVEEEDKFLLTESIKKKVDENWKSIKKLSHSVFNKNVKFGKKNENKTGNNFLSFNLERYENIKVVQSQDSQNPLKLILDID